MSTTSKNAPTDPKLYARIKRKVYEKIPTHSAYRSGRVVQRYKLEFKKKYGTKKKPYTGTKPRKTGLSRWFKEEWRNQRGQVGYQFRGDIYRPTRRVTRQTPVTLKELTKKRIQRARRRKATTGRARF